MLEGARSGARPVVWISQKDGLCVGCGSAVERGAFIAIDRKQGTRCVACAGFGDLRFLLARDVVLMRRALAHSSRSAFVVQFSRTRKALRALGVLVEESAIKEAEDEHVADEGHRARARQGRDAAAETYLAQFTTKIRVLFPRVPHQVAALIAARACENYSARVGRSAEATAFHDKGVTLAVQAHVRHTHTAYDRLLVEGATPAEARLAVRSTVENVLSRWRAGRA